VVDEEARGYRDTDPHFVTITSMTSTVLGRHSAMDALSAVLNNKDEV
jgi:hypothetical protein